MKFRFYQLLLVASLVFTILAMLDPVVSFTESNGAASVMTNFKYTEFATGNVSRSVIALGILAFVVIIMSFCPGYIFNQIGTMADIGNF